VRVICPRGAGQPRSEVIDDVEITRFAQPLEGRDRAGLLFEYAVAFVILSLAIIRERARGPIDVVQVVSPPDWLAIPASMLRPLGARLVFDLADLSPALYEAKFGKRGPIYALVTLLNRLVLQRADLVVTANESYRRVAVALGRRASGTTIAIHSYPEALADRRESRPPGRLRIGYFGVLGAQDGVELLLLAAARLKMCPEVPDFEVLIVGDGPNAKRLHSLSHELGLGGAAQFLGFLEGAARDEAVSSFDVAVAADPLNRYTRMISMNKIFVYAANGLPIVSTPLPGTRRLLADAAMYTADCSPPAMATALHSVLRDPSLRHGLALRARRRAEECFDWNSAAAMYVRAVADVAARSRGTR
jgi:glycosyltransferase involved in cell wall biosynthesis